MFKLIFLIPVAILVIGILIELIVLLDIAEERERQMTLWKPPGTPGKPNERSDDRAGG